MTQARMLRLSADLAAWIKRQGVEGADAKAFAVLLVSTGADLAETSGMDPVLVLQAMIVSVQRDQQEENPSR